jgi:hypothetical protein
MRHASVNASLGADIQRKGSEQANLPGPFCFSLRELSAFALAE